MSLDFEADLACVPNTMTTAVGIDNADEINDALADIGIGGGNGTSAIGDGHGKFWAVATEIHATITNATNASPIVVTAPSHGLVTNDKIGIRNVTGNTAANGVWFVTRIDDNTFSLVGSTGNGAYISGGEWWHCRIIRIPERSGGTFYGTGRQLWRVVATNASTHVVNSGIHEGRVIGATTLVNTSDPSIIDTTSVIGYFGIGWNIGPMHINGAYARTTDDANTLYANNDMAAVGFENTVRGQSSISGKVSLDLSYANCYSAYRATAQPHYTGHGDNVVHTMFDCRACRVGIGIDENQAVGNSILYARFAGIPVAFDLVDGGGNTHVSEAVMLDGGTFLKGSGLNSNSGRFDCDYIKVDSGENPSTIVELTKDQAHSIRIKGQVGGNAISSNAAVDQRFIKTAGLAPDIEFDLKGLPRDEATAWARKPYPTFVPTVFHSPDLGLDADESQYVPDFTNCLLWLDSTDGSTIDQSTAAGRVKVWEDQSGNGNDVEQSTAADEPIYALDGLHHRPAVHWSAGDRPLTRPPQSATSTTPAGFSGMDDLEIWIVASLTRNGTPPRTRTLASVWRSTNGERCWIVEHIQNSSQDSGNVVRVTLSQDGINASHQLSSDANVVLPFDTPLLILVRYEKATGALTLDVDKRSVTSTNGTAASLRTTSTARLAIGCHFNNSNVVSQSWFGRVGFVAIKNALSNMTTNGNGTLLRRHLRRKLGTW